MAVPGETTHRIVKVIDSTGAAVTGLVLAGFTVTAYQRSYGAGAWSTYSSGAALVELGLGFYAFAFALPASAGWWRVLLEHAVQRVWNGSWEGEVENNDWDKLYGSTVQPIATLATGVNLGNQVALEVVANRWRSIDITIRDQAGNPYATLGTDFPSANLKIGIRSKDGTTTNWQAGPSGVITTGGGTAGNFVITTSGSTLHIELPEDSGFFSALAAGVDSLDLYWEVTGDLNGTAAKTQPIIRSSGCRLTRKEAA